MPAVSVHTPLGSAGPQEHVLLTPTKLLTDKPTKARTNMLRSRAAINSNRTALVVEPPLGLKVYQGLLGVTTRRTNTEVYVHPGAVKKEAFRLLEDILTIMDQPSRYELDFKLSEQKQAANVDPAPTIFNWLAKFLRPSSAKPKNHYVIPYGGTEGTPVTVVSHISHQDICGTDIGPGYL
ncbi:unnamed protein product [Cyprideis torosa]|uniref:Uncharacterized protein n=1 Tax=Cyprideis torosa TaxID=163714 RepID=A0A7R8ZMI3_9CRUS|nr:unnamed protein product [Cyprideis torosa]CAG0888887.1 unnamed protein product [Cyprideis torosa]